MLTGINMPQNNKSSDVLRKLNAELTQEVARRRAIEEQLLVAKAELEQNVTARTSELKEALQALQKSQERLELVLDASELALWDWDLVSDKVYHTRTEMIFGLAADKIHGVLTDLRPLMHPDDLPVLRHAMIEHMQQRSDSYAVEYRVKHTSGHWLWIEDRGRAVERDENGRVLRMLGTRRDISLRKQHDKELDLASRVFDAGGESIVILDPQYNILAVNKAFMATTGFTRDEIIGQPILPDNQPIEVRKRHDKICSYSELHGSWEGESLGLRKSGETYPLWLRTHVVRDNCGLITHIVAFFTDLTASRQTEERLNYLTQYDELTGLANRALFYKRLHHVAEHARKHREQVALLHLDLDRFKALNSSLGVEAADQVLRMISERLMQLLPEANTLARLGADEFAIILDENVSAANLVQLAHSLLEQIRMPVGVVVGGNELVISGSLGVSVLPGNAREPAVLISQANLAMQHAKHLGGDNVQFYSNQTQTLTLERLELEQELRRGIEAGELQAYYQPKVTLSDGVIRSAEALVRWHHPQRGLLASGEFIELAEDTGLIGAITEQVLEKACQQAYIWWQQGMYIRTSVNISVCRVRQGNLVELVKNVLAKTGLPGYLLELELTESQMLDNTQDIIATFKLIRELGVNLAIDDFGTGYSSLSYLKRFPANSLKIDQSFIRDVLNNDEDAAITRAIIAMAHSLNLLVVAEGVETQAQMEFLKAHACDEIQGYLISRPIPADELTQMLISRKSVLES